MRISSHYFTVKSYHTIRVGFSPRRISKTTFVHTHFHQLCFYVPHQVNTLNIQLNCYIISSSMTTAVNNLHPISSHTWCMMHASVLPHLIYRINVHYYSTMVGPRWLSGLGYWMPQCLLAWQADGSRRPEFKSRSGREFFSSIGLAGMLRD